MDLQSRLETLDDRYRKHYADQFESYKKKKEQQYFRDIVMMSIIFGSVIMYNIFGNFK